MNTDIQKAPDYPDDPALSLGTKAFLRVLNSGGPVEELPPQQARAVLAQVQSGVQVDLSGIEESKKTVEADGHAVELDIVRPVGAEGDLPAFVFIHGGGWVLGDYPTHQRLVRDLVVASGCACVFINYTPSPEAKYPQAVNELFAGLKWVAAHGKEIGVDGQRLAVVGNSVGGNMSLVMGLMAKENNGPALATLVLLWPVTDSAFDSDSYALYGEQRFLTTSLMQWMFDQYTDDAHTRLEPYIAPLKALRRQLKGLPPITIHVAENDILRDQGEAMGRRLDEAGVDVITLRYNGVIHDWGMLNGFATLPQTRVLIDNVAAQLRRYLKP